MPSRGTGRQGPAVLGQVHRKLLTQEGGQEERWVQEAWMQRQLHHRALENRQEKSIPDAVSAQELRSKVRVPGALEALSLVGGGVTVDE